MVLIFYNSSFVQNFNILGYKLQLTLFNEGVNFPSFCRYMLLQVWMAYLQGPSSRNSSVKRVSSPHGTFSSTWISSWLSDRCAYRFLPIDRRLTWGLAARWTYHNSASPGFLAVHWRLSALAPKKYPLARLLKAQRPEKSSQTDISNLDVSSVSSCNNIQTIWPFQACKILCWNKWFLYLNLN